MGKKGKNKSAAVATSSESPPKITPNEEKKIVEVEPAPAPAPEVKKESPSAVKELCDKAPQNIELESPKASKSKKSKNE